MHRLVNPDYNDMLSALLDAGAEFLVVGAYAMAAHGFPRATGDIDGSGQLKKMQIAFGQR